MRSSLLHGLLAVAFVSTAPATGRAELPAKLKAEGAELRLNGSGARTKYLMEMYVAGLYLAEPSRDAAAIIAANNPMAIRLEITSGLVSQEKLLAALNEGFDNSTGGKTESLRREIERFRKCFASEIDKGDVFDLVYHPSRGVEVIKNGKLQGQVPGLAFKEALFGIWLSNKPADEDLKLALLGK
jgi:hypothetical protein